MVGPLGPRLSATEGGRRDGKRVSLPLPAATHPKIYYSFALYFLGFFGYVYFNVTKGPVKSADLNGNAWEAVTKPICFEFRSIQFGEDRCVRKQARL